MIEKLKEHADSLIAVAFVALVSITALAIYLTHPDLLASHPPLMNQR